jgi:hypothetical protein
MSAPKKLHELLDAAYDEHPCCTFSYTRHEARDGSWHTLTDANGLWQISVTEANDGELTWKRFERGRTVWREL